MPKVAPETLIDFETVGQRAYHPGLLPMYEALQAIVAENVGKQATLQRWEWTGPSSINPDPRGGQQNRDVMVVAREGIIAEDTLKMIGNRVLLPTDGYIETVTEGWSEVSRTEERGGLPIDRDSRGGWDLKYGVNDPEAVALLGILRSEPYNAEVFKGLYPAEMRRDYMRTRLWIDGAQFESQHFRRMSGWLAGQCLA